VKVNQRALSVTQRALSVTQRALSVTQRALSVTQRAFNVTQRDGGAERRAVGATGAAERMQMEAEAAALRPQQTGAQLSSSVVPPAAPTPHRDAEEAAGAEELYYVKDWHHVAEFPAYGAYDTPPWFRDDWLNWAHDAQHEAINWAHDAQHEATRGAAAHAAPDTAAAAAAASQCADYRFVYLGPAGSFTALHAARARLCSHPRAFYSATATPADARRLLGLGKGFPHPPTPLAPHSRALAPVPPQDVLRSFSWSVNVCGWKRWRLWPPEETVCAPPFAPQRFLGDAKRFLGDAKRSWVTLIDPTAPAVGPPRPPAAADGGGRRGGSIPHAARRVLRGGAAGPGRGVVRA
jgi:hypothetical protein